MVNYRSFTIEDWKNYKFQIESTLKINNMAVLQNKETLKWINKILKKFDNEQKNTEKQN